MKTKLLPFEGNENKELQQAVQELKKFNRSFTGPFEKEEFGFLAKNKKGELIGAISANTEWEWIFIKHLWIRDRMRGKGLGSRLMDAIISEANGRGIYKYYLSTFSFQAPDFYRKLGFEVFGTLPGVSASYDSYFMKREDQ